MYTRVRGEYAACVCVFMPLRRGPRMAGPGLFLPRGPDVPDGCLAQGDVCSDAHSPLPGPGALVFSSVRKGHPEKEVAGSGEGSLLEPP